MSKIVLKIKDKKPINLKLENPVVEIEPKLENIEITPSKEEQTFKSKNYYGYDEVKVNGVTNEIDNNIKPENIKEGVSILGVSGNVEDLTEGLEIYNTELTEQEITVNNIVEALKDKGITGGVEELKTSYLSAFDNTLGANVTKLPDGITYIRERAFYKCTNLALTSLPNSITTIEMYSFAQCEKLALTSLPNSLSRINSYAFQNCFKLKITSVPVGITSISSYVFAGCKEMTELTINGAITTISSNAFLNCSSLAKIVFPNVTSVPTLSSATAFTGTPIAKETGYVYFPDSMVDNVKSASNWSAFANQIKGVSEL